MMSFNLHTSTNPQTTAGPAALSVSGHSNSSIFGFRYHVFASPNAKRDTEFTLPRESLLEGQRRVPTSCSLVQCSHENLGTSSQAALQVKHLRENSDAGGHQQRQERDWGHLAWEIDGDRVYDDSRYAHDIASG